MTQPKTASISLDLGNSAFEDDPGHEIARILRELADKLECGVIGTHFQCNLSDYNGNIVGTFKCK